MVFACALLFCFFVCFVSFFFFSLPVQDRCLLEVALVLHGEVVLFWCLLWLLAGDWELPEVRPVMLCFVVSYLFDFVSFFQVRCVCAVVFGFALVLVLQCLVGFL